MKTEMYRKGFLILCLSFLSGPRVWAAPIEVNATIDVIDSDDGLCTLREAIVATENNAESGSTNGECQDPDTNFDTIHLPASLVSYTLTIGGPDSGGQILPETADLDITEDLTLTGDGSGTTIIDGNGAVTMDRVFAIHGGIVDISGVTIQNGVATDGAGGGIVISAGQNPAVTLTDVVVTGNKATNTNSGGGIFNNATLTMDGCTVSVNETVGGNGGGVFNASSSSLTITRSTIDNNKALGNDGGGIFNNGGTLDFQYSTLSRNQADFGGGIRNAQGSGTADFLNATISGNTATTRGGGLTNDSTATLTVEFSTIFGNTAPTGGGLGKNGDSPASFEGTIVANNSGGNCDFTVDTSVGNNLEDTDTCGFGQGNDHPDTPSNLDPLLKNNGGPTETHALLPGSLAVDAIALADCAPSDDQRAVSRPQDGDNDSNSLCDIGAFELTPCGNGTVETGEQCDDGNALDGDCCSAACQFEAQGNACDDGDPVTSDQCDGAGQCVGTIPPEDCSNGTDDDGDNLVDCNDSDCAADPLCGPSAEICDNNVEDDGDGLADCVDPDCAVDVACRAFSLSGGGCSLGGGKAVHFSGLVPLLAMAWPLVRRRREIIS